MYFKHLLPRLVNPGDDGNCGSAAVCDTMCLQILSKRIHFGKFVAEAKFLENPATYETAIREQVKRHHALSFFFLVTLSFCHHKLTL